MEDFKADERITLVISRGYPFETKIPGYFVEIRGTTPPFCYYHTSIIKTCTTLAYIPLNSRNILLHGWETANKKRVERENRIVKHIRGKSVLWKKLYLHNYLSL